MPHFSHMEIAMLASSFLLQVPCVPHYHPIRGSIQCCGFFNTLLEYGMHWIEGSLAQEFWSFPIHSKIFQFICNLIRLSPDV